MQKIIKNGTLVTAIRTFQADIHIDGEKIESIAPEIDKPDLEVIDAAGKLILPGGIDPHTHFDLPMFDTVSSDDHYTGHKAAAFGGTTTVMDFVPQTPPSASGRGDGGEVCLRGDVTVWRAKADPNAAIDFGFHMNITHFDEAVAREIPALLDEGITTLKVFTAYNGRLRLLDGDIFNVMRIAKEYGMLTMLHAENGDIIEVLVAEALAAGNTSPEWHARTRPAWGAVESALRGFYVYLSKNPGSLSCFSALCKPYLRQRSHQFPNSVISSPHPLSPETVPRPISSPAGPQRWSAQTRFQSRLFSFAPLFPYFAI